MEYNLNNNTSTLSERSFDYQRRVSYDELINLINRKGLQPGTQYLLNDYKTKYRQPYTNVIKETDLTERLILTATSDNSLSQIASSLENLNDIIYYNVNNNVCEDGVTPRNGFIERRIDTVNFIDMPHDWRRMLWARFKATALTWTSGSVTRGHVRQRGNNLCLVTRTGTPTSATDTNFFQVICTTEEYFFPSNQTYQTFEGLTYNMTDYAQRYTFNGNDNLTLKSPSQSRLLSPEKIVIKGGSLGSNVNLKGLCNNVFMFSNNDNRPRNISFENNCYENTFRSNCHSITFGNSCYSNIFASDCYANTFADSCYCNTFASNCSKNIFGSNCHNNTFGSGCYANTFASNCFSNTFAINCNDNTFGSNCYANTFASNCNRNTFASDCSQNRFGSGGIKNTFSCSCFGNTFGNNFIWNNVMQCANVNASNISSLHSNINSCNFMLAEGRYVAFLYNTTTPTLINLR